MATIYTRAYSANSPRQLASGKGVAGSPLTMDDGERLLSEFQNHTNKYSEEPTALVSVSNRIIDTLNRAFRMHLVDGEDPSDIWIAFIEVPATTSATSAMVHQARPLAEAIGLENSSAFEHELVFEWAIPEKYIRHQVHLQTLLDRGLRYSDFLGPKLQYISTYEMRHVASVLDSTRPGSDPWGIGIFLGCFARVFGARAPSNWIAYQLFHDCVSTKIIRDDNVRIKDLRGRRAFVGFDFFSELEEGIDTALVDWWLAGLDFFSDYSEFKEWRDTMEDFMAWDIMDFCEIWNDCNESDGKWLHDKVEKKFSAKHKRLRAGIKAEAVRIGL